MVVEDKSVYTPNGAYVTYVSGDNIAGYGMNGQSFGSEVLQSKKRHLDGMNIAFVDGHVKWYSSQYLNKLGTSIPLAGFLNGARNSGQFYVHNGEIDMQVVE